ncbi:MAG: hypothetical protein H0V60_10210 [Actinobacteria bacterium]|nr:hypothetical protein [Actinomycetota bacterium]
MEVEAFLADSVVAAESKLFVQGGGWNIIHTATLPTQHPRIGIGMIVRIPYTATNQPHQFELRLEDEDGNQIALGKHSPGTAPEGEDETISQIDGEFNVGRPAGIFPGDEQFLPFAINLDGLRFEKVGAYRFVLKVDGSEVKTLPFRINQVPQVGPIPRPS